MRTHIYLLINKFPLGDSGVNNNEELSKLLVLFYINFIIF